VTSQSVESREQRFFEIVPILARHPEAAARVMAYGEAVLDGDHDRGREIVIDVQARWVVVQALGPGWCNPSSGKEL